MTLYCGYLWVRLGGWICAVYALYMLRICYGYVTGGDFCVEE